MKKLLLSLLIAGASCAQAGTVYRDRPIPSGLCMVDFFGNRFNGFLIQDVTSGNFKYLKDVNLFAPDTYTQNVEVQVKLVNNTVYRQTMPTVEEAAKARDAFIKSISETCSRN